MLKCPHAQIILQPPYTPMPTCHPPHRFLPSLTQQHDAVAHSVRQRAWAALPLSLYRRRVAALGSVQSGLVVARSKAQQRQLAVDGQQALCVRPKLLCQPPCACRQQWGCVDLGNGASSAADGRGAALQEKVGKDAAVGTSVFAGMRGRGHHVNTVPVSKSKPSSQLHLFLVR